MPFSVRIPCGVVDDIIAFAKESFPREFFAYLEGKRSGEKVEVSNLAYYPISANEDSVTTVFHLGTHTQGFVGSVHSHPSGSNSPSRQDLRSFNKEGVIHFIISKPFCKENLKCYLLDGKPADFEII